MTWEETSDGLTSGESGPGDSVATKMFIRLPAEMTAILFKAAESPGNTRSQLRSTFSPSKIQKWDVAAVAVAIVSVTVANVSAPGNVSVTKYVTKNVTTPVQAWASDSTVGLEPSATSGDADGSSLFLDSAYTSVPGVADLQIKPCSRGFCKPIRGNMIDVVMLPYSSTVYKNTSAYSSQSSNYYSTQSPANSYSSTVENNTFFLVPRKGGSRPSSPTPSPHQGKARHVPPIPVGPYSAGTLPLRGSSSAAPTPLLLQGGGKVSRTGAVAGASSSGATPATLPLSGVDARCRYYFCSDDEHRTPSLPLGREERPAVPHSLVLPLQAEKHQLLASLVSKVCLDAFY